jgi:AcrR family transcriptional regulator
MGSSLVGELLLRWRAMAATRKDAIRSREQIVEAAGDLLAEDAEANFAEIGVRAGLNQATVYRHFPDRSTLFAAVLEGTLERFEADVREWELTPDSFEKLLRLMAVQQARYRGLTSRIQRGELGPERRTAVQNQTCELFRPPLEVAKAGGAVRPDFSPTSVLLLLNMIDGVVAARRESPEAAASEAIDLIMAALRP